MGMGMGRPCEGLDFFSSMVRSICSFLLDLCVFLLFEAERSFMAYVYRGGGAILAL